MAQNDKLFNNFSYNSDLDKNAEKEQGLYRKLTTGNMSFTEIEKRY